MSDKTDVLLVYAEWCPHCKYFEPIFKNTENFLKKDKALKSNKINLKSFDFANEGTKQQFDEEYGSVSKYIDGFPTVLLRHEGEREVKYTTIDTSHEDQSIKEEKKRLNNATKQFVKNIKSGFDSLFPQKGGSNYETMLEHSLETQLHDMYWKKKYEYWKKKYIELKKTN